MIADKLRKSILQAAIQGKLTEQLASDGDARDLLADIQKEKKRLIKDKKIKKKQPLPAIEEDDIPFDIPDNWIWVRLGDIFTMQAGKNINANNIKASGNYLCYGGNGIRGYVDTFNQTGRYPLIGRQGALCGNINIADGEFYATEHAVVVDSYGFCDTDWEAYFLTALDLNQYATATAQPGLAVSKIAFVLIPLPPLAEQQRIVERLEKILPSIAALEKDESKLDTLQQSFPKKMKASLLQAAIQGKLTEQLASDGSAQDLLKDIQAEKKRLIKEGKIKKERPLPEITEEEIPFDIPDNWCWVRLGKIIFNHGQKKPNQNFTYIDISSIDNKKHCLGNLDTVLSPSKAPSRARKIVYEGDIIYSTVRPYLQNICIVDHKITPEPIVSTGFAVVCTPFLVVNKYLFMYLLSPVFNSYASSNENAKGVAYPAINDLRFLSAIVPLPPLEEQKRIVARLEELLPKCDELGI